MFFITSIDLCMTDESYFCRTPGQKPLAHPFPAATTTLPLPPPPSHRYLHTPPTPLGLGLGSSPPSTSGASAAGASPMTASYRTSVAASASVPPPASPSFVISLSEVLCGHQKDILIVPTPFPFPPGDLFSTDTTRAWRGATEDKAGHRQEEATGAARRRALVGATEMAQWLGMYGAPNLDSPTPARFLVLFGVFFKLYVSYRRFGYRLQSGYAWL
ncbi:hypothetical protein GUJ93_ZPchr0001g29771 [Zizania palustris]|uniref:Uncharacterized protein n=1 Tax=Zizania palustris TaxID=103762 RepID=A0A8J5R6W4_ZIZPA|nr:hypothetical protein GUJ93_ZPchr0001g29771 [Zizania palustris]